ncbi:NUMOD4 motif-containing HNH endonuclease [Peribacillus frigoritolerans]|nr:NUMOD4 motif-containing HNH endonuclease [Peribacillus frigoritolerans]
MKNAVEIWKNLSEIGFESYEVSSFGRIRSLDRYSRAKGGSKQLRKGKILAQRTDKDGYKQVTLWKDGKHKTYQSHRLVALAFIHNYSPNEKIEVHHINNIRDDNNISNLEWVTHAENMAHTKGSRKPRPTVIYADGLSISITITAS